jgi:hypothetical protein
MKEVLLRTHIRNILKEHYRDQLKEISLVAMGGRSGTSKKVVQYMKKNIKKVKDSARKAVQTIKNDSLSDSEKEVRMKLNDLKTAQSIEETLIREYVSRNLIISRRLYQSEDELLNEVLGKIIKGMAKSAKAAVKIGSTVAKVGAKAASYAATKGLKVTKALAKSTIGAVKAGTEKVMGSDSQEEPATPLEPTKEESEKIKKLESSLSAADNSMQKMANSSDALQTSLQNTVSQFPEELQTAMVTAGEASLENVQNSFNGELEAIVAAIAEQSPDSNEESIRQQAMLSLGSVVAKVVKDLSSKK